MMEMEFERKDQPQGLSIIGPFTEHRVALDGYLVPRLTAVQIGNDTEFVLDNRFSLQVPNEYATQVAFLIANAMAVSAGFTCFGENSQEANRFQIKIAELGVSFSGNAIH